MPKYKDLTGQKFTKLTVIERVGVSPTHSALWRCVCECGREKIVSSDSLKRQYGTKSCGCLKYTAHNDASFNELLSTYRSNASKRNLEWSLSKEQFRELTGQNCYYCGKEPFNVYRRKTILYPNGSYKYNGVDRIDNHIGYIVGNVVPCCKHCNIAKATRSYDEFIGWIRSVYNHLGVRS